MKKNEEPFQMKGKGMAAAIAICFIAVVALVGAYTFSSYKREMKEQLAKAEEEQKEKEREAEEKEQDAHPAEDAARMKEQSVLPGKKRERLSLRDERQEEEPHEAAYKRQLAGPQVGDRFRRHVHQ